MSSVTPAIPPDPHNDKCWMDLVFQTYIEPLHCVNFSIYGDQTQNVLWRIANGELDDVSPKVIVIMTGTHNVSNNSAEIVSGILSIVEQVKKKLPQTAIIVMGLLPCGHGPNNRRTKHEEVNRLLVEKFHQKLEVTFLNPDWKQFIQPDETISHRDLFDYVHPTESGYKKMVEPLIEELQNSLQTFLKTNAPSSFTEEL